jgi:Glycosyl transferase family 11
MARADDEYVIVELAGRLGNQLFQFASGLGLARRRDAQLLFRSWRVPPDDLLLPKLIPDQYQEAGARELLRIGQFPYDVPLARVFQSVNVRVARWSRAARQRTKPAIAAWGDTGVFRPWIFDLDFPVYLQGHLQSERYFAEVSADITAMIQWPTGTPSLPDDVGTTVAVSFRRGDYNSLGWALPLSYYDEALGLACESLVSPTLVLFGDDADFLELAGTRYSQFGRVVNALELGSDPISQLRLMSQCDHCVIANSSFAWWGAWLGDQHPTRMNRVVVAPSAYGGNNDRIPARWLTVATHASTRV